MLQVMELSWCGRSLEVLSNLLSLANVDRACVDTVPHRGSDIDESGQRYLAQPVEFVRGHGAFTRAIQGMLSLLSVQVFIKQQLELIASVFLDLV